MIESNPAYPGRHFIVNVQDSIIYCARCRQECQYIPAGETLIVWCKNTFCENVLELRRKKGEPFRVCSYGEAVEDYEMDLSLRRLLADPNPDE
jgi:hypothetical protein